VKESMKTGFGLNAISSSLYTLSVRESSIRTKMYESEKNFVWFDSNASALSYVPKCMANVVLQTTIQNCMLDYENVNPWS